MDYKGFLLDYLDYSTLHGIDHGLPKISKWTN